MESETPIATRESPVTNCVTTVTQTAPFSPYLDTGDWLHIIRVHLRPLELP